MKAEQSAKDYLTALDQAVDEDRLAHGKKPLPSRSKTPEKRTIKQSTTDPDSGYMQSYGHVLSVRVTCSNSSPCTTDNALLAGKAGRGFNPVFRKLLEKPNMLSRFFL